MATKVRLVRSERVPKCYLMSAVEVDVGSLAEATWRSVGFVDASAALPIDAPVETPKESKPKRKTRPSLYAESEES